MFEQISRSSDVLSIFSSSSTGNLNVNSSTCFNSVRHVVTNIKSEKRDFLFDDTDTINSVENNNINSSNNNNNNNMNKIIMPDINNDNSCCSDDSDLSVGKEVFDKEEETTEVTDSSTKNKSLIVNNSNPKHRVNEVLLSCASSCSEFATDADEDAATDQDSGVNDSNQLCSNANNNNINNNKLMIKNHVDNIKEKIFANNLLFCDNSSIFNINSSPMKFQEDFLKSTQLYAENLMRQKLPIAACPKEDKQLHNDNAQSMQFDGKEGEASVRHNRLNFHNLHSHLNAITQIAHNLPLTKTALPINVDLLSRESSMSPPNNVQHPYLTPHCLRMQQHNLNEQNLKFSIDNILKADFGRRITDPLLRNSSTKSNSFKETNRKSHNHNQEQKTSSSAASPIDLTYSYENNSTNARPPEEKSSSNSSSSAKGEKEPMMWPAWIYCTRYSDRPSSGPRVKKTKRAEKTTTSSETSEDKRPRTAFSGPQLARLKHEFNENRYLTEKRRQQLSSELGLNEAQIKIWFQNKRAKIKKSSGQKNPLALQLMAQGLYNHSTVPLTREEEELQESNS